jgi:hypothetical protein
LGTCSTLWSRPLKATGETLICGPPLCPCKDCSLPHQAKVSLPLFPSLFLKRALGVILSSSILFSKSRLRPISHLKTVPNKWSRFGIFILYLHLAVMAPNHRRGPWVPEEDQALLHLVREQGPNNWVRISQHMHFRSPKQCRERFHQNLKPSLNHAPISANEGIMIERW